MKLYPQAFNTFAQTSGRLKTQSSVQSFRYVLGPLQARHSSYHVADFSPSDLTDFCNEPGLAPRTVKHRRAVLRSFFEWAEFKGLATSNPASVLKFTVSPGSHDVRPGRWLSELEVGQIVQSCPDDFWGRRDRVVLLFGFLMGLRVSEISSLTWSHFSPDLSVLTLKGKGQKIARMAVPPQVLSVLEAWRAEAPDGAVAVVPSTRDVFESARVDWSTPLGRTGSYAAVRRAGARCGLSLSPHDMRRSFAGVLESQGVAVQKIQLAMRHSNLGTTSVYLDKNPSKAMAVTESFTMNLGGER
jgi:integrase/recombinase XerD